MLIPKWSGYPDLRGRAKEEGLAKEVRRNGQGRRSIWVSQEVSFGREGMKESLGNLVKTGAECPLELVVRGGWDPGKGCLGEWWGWRPRMQVQRRKMRQGKFPEVLAVKGAVNGVGKLEAAWSQGRDSLF